MKKTYVLDTNVLLSDPDSLYSFEDSNVIIPLIVLEELDTKKSHPDHVGRNARQVSRNLDDLREVGSLHDGVMLRSGGTLKVAILKQFDQKTTELKANVDNRIIHYMIELSNNKVNAKLISNDLNVRIKCDALNIASEGYAIQHVKKGSSDNFFTGVTTIESSATDINEFYANSEINTSSDFLPNEIIVMKTSEIEGKLSAVARYDSEEKSLKKLIEYKEVFGLVPRNKEQNFSLNLLMDPNIKLVTMLGKAGCGKTLLAVAAALEQHKKLGNKKLYDKIVITRPVLPVGKDIGFLPGTLQEKMDPWIAPIRDNLEFLLGQNNGTDKRPTKNKGKITAEPYIDIMQENGEIEIEAITFIRGRSIPNSFMIIDEAQNLSIHELKTIITRVGEGTKIVLTGDIEQIDNTNVDVFNNGLIYAVEKFKDHSIAGHITLLKGERSVLATLASDIL